MMNKNLVTTFVIVTFISTFIKLSTSIIMLPDDASILLVLRFIPAFNNEIVTSDLSEMIVLISDENQLLGQAFYELLTNYIWWIASSILILNWFFNIVKNK